MSLPSHSASFTTPLQWALGLAMGVTSIGTAWAQSATPPADVPAPYYIGAGLGLSYDSNISRQSSGGTSDTWTSLSLLGGVNQTFGRQRLYLDGNIADNRYQDSKSLNNTSYGLNTGLNWETVGSLSGNVRYGLAQSLANQALAGTSSSNRNSQKTQLVGTSARYAMNSRVALEGGYQHRRVDYSLDVFAPLENTQNVANVGVVFGLSGLLTMGVGARASKTDTPRYDALGADEADRKDIDLTLSWSPSGLSTINGRLSASKEDHTRATASNFSGVTGALSWDYRPSGRLNFNTSFSRDTGSESRFLGFASAPTTGTGTGSTGSTGSISTGAGSTGTGTTSTATATEIYRLTNTLSASATYQLTGKISSTAFVSRGRASVVGNGVNTAAGTDTLTSYGLGATYLPTRNVSLSCRLGHEGRSTNSALSSSYSANTLGCLANVYLR